MPEDHKKFFKATLIVGICTFLSQVLGLLRSTLIASIYGATSGGGLSDAYTAAFKLPNVIFNLVAAGIISIVLIPYFLDIQKNKNSEELNRAVSGFINFFLIIVSVAIVLGIIFAEPLVRNILLAGWSNEENIRLTVEMTRIIFLQVLLFTLSSVFGSYLNALEKFTAYAFAMLSYNAGIILGILFLAPIIGITGVAWGVVAGAFLHFSIQLAGSIKNGFRYSLSLPSVDKKLIAMTLNGVPRVVTLGSEQIMRFALVTFASFLFTGAIIIFDNVENIGYVPYSLMAISISTTAFPIFIKYYNDKDYSGLYKSLFDKLRLLLFFILPVCTVMFVFRNEVVDLLIGYNKYGPEDVRITARALGYYIAGVPFLAMTLVIVKFYYAMVKSFIPMFVAIASLAISLALCYVLSDTMNVPGLALGRSIGNFIQAALLVLMLVVFMKKHLHDKKIPLGPVLDILKIAGLCVVIFLLSFAIQTCFNPFANYKLNAIVKLSVSAFLLVPVYFFLAHSIKIPDSALVSFRKKRKTETP